MTKKDFQVIAKILNKNLDSMPTDIHFNLVADFAKELKNINSQFDKAKFLKASGVMS